MLPIVARPSNCLVHRQPQRGGILGTGLDVNPTPRYPAGREMGACVHVPGLSCFRVPFAGVLVLNLTAVECKKRVS